LDDVQRIRMIIDHVRLFSRLQGHDDLEQVDINHTISECVNVFAPVFNKLDIIIKLALHPKKMVVVGNRYKIEQVLLNLLSNAKDTTIDKRQHNEIKTKQTIEVRSKLVGESVVISVVDEGMGIDAETRDKIFDPFFTTKNPDMGTGLGLAISYGIVSEMNGVLRVHSVPGAGSTFEISLPTIGGVYE
jgi:two-component system, NtrC family, sensor kinase